MWLGGTEEGTDLTAHNIASVHNQLLPSKFSKYAFNSKLARGTAQIEYKRLYYGCIPVANQSVLGPPAAWCQTTSYTSLHALGGGKFVIVYDQKSGHLYDSNAVGGTRPDTVWSMRFTVKTDDTPLVPPQGLPLSSCFYLSENSLAAGGSLVVTRHIHCHP